MRAIIGKSGHGRVGDIIFTVEVSRPFLQALLSLPSAIEMGDDIIELPRPVMIAYVDRIVLRPPFAIHAGTFPAVVDLPREIQFLETTTFGEL